MRNLAILTLILTLSGCGEVPRARPGTCVDVSQGYNNIVKTIRFSTANNSSFYIDEVLIDGTPFLVLHDGSVVGMVKKIISNDPKPIQIPTKSLTFSSAGNSRYGIDLVYIDGVSYAVVHDGRAKMIVSGLDISIPQPNAEKE